MLRRRFVALVLVMATGSLLGVATYLTPNAEGYGTHTQLGFDRCTWETTLGIPCTTCGMTTSFAFAAEGDFAASFWSQPFGCLLAISTAMVLLLSLYVLLTGSPVADRLTRFWSARVGWMVAGLVLVAWGYKILQFKGVL